MPKLKPNGLVCSTDKSLAHCLPSLRDRQILYRTVIGSELLSKSFVLYYRSLYLAWRSAYPVPTTSLTNDSLLFFSRFLVSAFSPIFFRPDPRCSRSAQTIVGKRRSIYFKSEFIQKTNKFSSSFFFQWKKSTKNPSDAYHPRKYGTRWNLVRYTRICS